MKQIIINQRPELKKSIEKAFDGKVISINKLGDLSVAYNKLIEGKIERVIYISSYKLYGEKTRFPSEEGFKPDPLEENTFNIWVGELLGEMYAKRNEFEFIILRPFSIYGTGESVIDKFLDCKNKNILPTVFGSGEQTRDFIKITDVIKVMKYFLDKPIEKNSLILNIGTGVQTSILDLIDLFKFKDYEQGKRYKWEVKQSQASTEQIVFMDLKPEVELEKYIGEALIK